ncbi:CDP-glycerol glycerophosphotransferase family protein [Vibrio campbellii]|uniref:CDP-glycerol glycerophosphotransferase family protein n=1 Tax=Vibrio campbellii TaxID=680 RepID=UPI00249B8CFA|nr:CDP-glycerol glycerophosphotransferase family protein [Vibrio campbellii]
MKNFFHILLSIISHLAPKRNIILFNSGKLPSDNPYALYQHILSDVRYSNYVFVWYVEKGAEKSKIPLDIKNEKRCKIISSKLKLEYYNVICKVVIHSHGWASRKLYPKKLPISVNLWHGLPIKKIGLDVNSEQKIYKDDYFMISSEYFDRFFSSSMNVERDNIVRLGQPRNDWLFYNVENKTERYVVWMPTFKKSMYDNTVNDGINELNKVSFLDFKNADRLNREISRFDIKLYIKLHPFDTLNLADFPVLSNIEVLKSTDFRISGDKLYKFLSSSSALISDYSSIVFDYALLNRPICIDKFSCDSYSRELYFKFDDVISDYYTVTNAEELEEFITNIGKHENTKLTSHVSIVDKYGENSNSIAEFILGKLE